MDVSKYISLVTMRDSTWNPKVVRIDLKDKQYLMRLDGITNC